MRRAHGRYTLEAGWTARRTRQASIRKRDPNAVISDFHALIEDSLDDWLKVQALVQGERTLLRRSTVDAFLQAAVAWERFKSDWYIACVNRDSSALGATLEDKLRQVAAGRGLPERYVSLTLPTHPTLSGVGELLDPQGANLGLGQYDRWKRRAGEELSPRYLTALASWSPADRAVHDAVSAIRNCIVHQSTKSVGEMNKALAKAPLPASLRRSGNAVSARGVGAYLTAQTDPPMRRMEILVTELHDLAGRLQV